jgi:hypothetical protein
MFQYQKPWGHWKYWLSIRAVCILLCFQIGQVRAETNVNPFLFTLQGTANSVTGYPGLAYQAIRYEPLCGNLGTDARFKDPIDISGRCTPAMDAFGNNTEDTLALYDGTGSRLKNGRVGGGYEVCLCFAMQQTGDGLKGAMCLWVDGSGRGDAWWALAYDRIAAGNYRPNVAKALPLCKDVDVDALKASWSATAVQPSVTEKFATVPGPETKLVTSTFIPSGKLNY